MWRRWSRRRSADTIHSTAPVPRRSTVVPSRPARSIPVTASEPAAAVVWAGAAGAGAGGGVVEVVGEVGVTGTGWTARSTVRVKAWVASGVTPFAAVTVKEYVPPDPAGGVPESIPVVGSVESHVGTEPLREKVGLGVPVAITVKVPLSPAVKVVVSGEVMWGPRRGCRR